VAFGASSIDRGRFREVLGHFASGVTVVTASEEGVPVGFTCQSFASLSLDPPLVVFAAATTSTSWPKMAAAGSFCINILEEHQEPLSRAFAESGSDKFAGVAWTPAASGAPVIAGCLAWIDCELERIAEAGDHELVIGRVLDLGSGPGAPLLFYRGGFGGFRV
jgi:flavin reductase (DIM6/NTAB) family NADH-FMN oxidoreductase RutF